MSDHEFPEFLSLIDSDPRKAAELFAKWVLSMFAVKPPRVLVWVDRGQREDAINDIILHCLEDNMRVLRMYKPQGKPFAGWFYFVAANVLHDRYFRQRTGSDEVPIDHDDDDRGDEKYADVRPANNPGTPGKEAVELVRSVIAGMGQKCRTLLRLAAEEFKPQEIAKVLRMPKDQAKKISDDLGYCRRKLASLLAEMGHSLEDLLER